MSQNVIQTSFASGELSPNLYAHVDLAKYHTGVALARNFFVDYRGGLSTRQGLEFTCQTKYSVKATRLIPFQFSVIQTYMLEFGDLYIRFIQDGAQILEASKTILGFSNANPGVVQVNAHGYVTGNWVTLTLNGMPALSGYTAKVVLIDANHFSLLNPINDVALSTIGFGTFISGTVARVYEIITPYLAADLNELKFTQSADTMTITHPDYAPRNLTRTGSTSWTLTPISFVTTQAPPTAFIATPTAAGTTNYSYVVSAVGSDGQESLTPVGIFVLNAVNIAVTAGAIALGWTGAAGAAYYNVYKAQPATGVALPSGMNYGFIGSTTSTSFVDGNIVPDFATAPPSSENPFAGNNPATVGYFQQRLVFAGSNTFPETLWASQPGAFNNFNTTNPSADDNAITATLISNQVNNIKHMVAMPGGLVVLTGGGAWQVSGGGSDAPITPRTVTATPQAYNGCSDVPPIVINYDIIYNQARGSVVRDLSYSFYTNIYTGADISVMSNHLLIGRSIVGWAYAEDPFKVIWSVTSDGELLSLTYLKEQEVIGWAHHDTYGLFTSVAQIPEGNTSAVYAVVKRTVLGQTVQFIERMKEREFPYGSEDSFCVDAGLKSTQTEPAATLTASAVTGAGVVFTADAAVFTNADVGKILRAKGGIATITAFTDTTHLVGTFTRDMDDVIYNGDDEPQPVAAASGDWSLTAKATTFYGLLHLQGQTVKLLGDGNVFPDQVVSALGSVTVSESVSKLVAGLGFTGQIKTLYLDVGEPTIQGKRKKIAAMSVRVHQTRGLKMGTDFSADNLVEYKMRNDQPMGQPIELETGDQRIVMPPLWQTAGVVCIQQDYPLPATVLGIIPEIVVGDTK